MVMTMEAYEREAERQARAEANKHKFGPPQVSSVGDIQRVVAQLDPTNRLNTQSGISQVATTMRGNQEGTRSQGMFAVRSESADKSYRDILLEGLRTLRSRQDAVKKAMASAMPVEVDDRPMMPPPIIDKDVSMSIDPIIERLLGGRREGELVCWDLADGYTYKYNVFEHRLTRVPRDA